MKRKLFSLFASAALCFTVSAGYVSAEEDIMYGDINGNSIIDLSDLSELSLILLGENEADEKQMKTADINADGKLNVSDLAMMKRYINGSSVRLGGKDEYSSIIVEKIYSFITECPSGGCAEPDYDFNQVDKTNFQHSGYGELITSFEEFAELTENYKNKIFVKDNEFSFKDRFFNNYSFVKYTNTVYDESFFEDYVLFIAFEELPYGVTIEDASLDIGEDKITIDTNIAHSTLSSDKASIHIWATVAEIPKSMYNEQKFSYSSLWLRLK
ncbi:MAG: hypothetical protein E7505_08415 [Ruminococcus sp.]|nr:hypothetical protein [Ruminococcus sp.]